MTLRELLDRVARGETAPGDAEEFLAGYGFVALGHQRFDTHREGRTAVPEVVLGLTKDVAQLAEIVGYFAARELPLLLTRVDESKASALVARHPELTYLPEARVLRLGRSSRHARGSVAVVTAGSSDQPVAEEAVATLEFFQVPAVRAYDCGVAGLHRLYAQGEAIAAADVIIAVAGMEGALASVVAGLFPRPVVAVPTSVGYGASFGGLAALLAMMNSCAPGVTVVNIDNGFGAAVAAAAMLRVGERR
jgi:pyridinium-3,5-biscarboxylic acid mononucleotide synthase